MFHCQIPFRCEGITTGSRNEARNLPGSAVAAHAPTQQLVRLAQGFSEQPASHREEFLFLALDVP
jgi:hypothetical protein